MEAQTKPREEFDESFATLCSIGILLLTDAIDLAAVKQIFRTAMTSVPFSELQSFPEFRAAWERVGQFLPLPVEM